MTMRKVYAQLENNEEALVEGFIPKWDSHLPVIVGMTLIEWILPIIKWKNQLGEEHQVFCLTKRRIGVKTPGVIQINSDIYKLMSEKNITAVTESLMIGC